MVHENVIYLDHAATSWPKPPAVEAAVAASLSALQANAGRSGHRPALAAARQVFGVRQRAAALLGIANSADLIFTRGATEGLNLVLKGWLPAGARVAVSPLEHNAVRRPLARLAAERRIEITTLPADSWGRIELDAARRLTRQHRFDLVCVAHGSNVNGVVQDLVGLREVFSESAILVDAAQTAGVLPLEVDHWRIDFLACSAHKGLLGLTGLGLCYLSPKHDVQPLIEGGTGSASDAFDQPAFRPDRYEAGTLNLHGIAGLGGALAGVADRGLLGPHKCRLSARLIDGLRSLPGVHLYSPDDGTALCVAFNIEGLPPESVAARLESEYTILCRPGLHCAPAAHRHLRTFPGGCVRLAPGWGTNGEMIETTIRAVEQIASR